MAGQDRSQIVAVILAGGKSKRFGRNKALELVEDSPLIQRVYGFLEQIFNKILVVTNRPEAYAFLGCEVIRDRLPGLGPLVGIYSGLKHIYPLSGFFFPCDMPLLNRELIEYMCSIYDDRTDILVPQVGENLYEPLHALYGPRCIPKIEDLLEEKIYRIFYLFKKVKVRYLPLSDLERFDPKLTCFTNINTKEDLSKFLKEYNGY